MHIKKNKEVFRITFCYYCGGNHRTIACPIEAQQQTTRAIEKFGYKESSEISNLAQAQRDSSKEISSSLDSLSNNISHSFGEISNVIRELTEVFEYNHAEMMWQMEKQLEVLTGIHNLIENPRARDANEALKMGIESFKRGMIKQSLDLLQDAEKLNPLDYRIYLTMGHVYLKKDDLENALDRFEYALKNARTNFYESYSLLLISRIYYCKGDIEKAINCTRSAIEKTPDYAEAHYQYATYISVNCS